MHLSISVNLTLCRKFPNVIIYIENRLFSNENDRNPDKVRKI